MKLTNTADDWAAHFTFKQGEPKDKRTRTHAIHGKDKCSPLHMQWHGNEHGNDDKFGSMTTKTLARGLCQLPHSVMTFHSAILSISNCDSAAGHTESTNKRDGDAKVRKVEGSITY